MAAVAAPLAVGAKPAAATAAREASVVAPMGLAPRARWFRVRGRGRGRVWVRVRVRVRVRVIGLGLGLGLGLG